VLILSPGLVLAQPQIINDGTPLIGWRNVVTVSNVTATNENPNYLALNLANPSTVLTWLAANNATQYLTVTLNSPAPVDYLAVARHNFGTVGATLTVERKVDGVWEEIAGPVLPGDDTHILFRFAEIEPEGVRLKITGASAAPTLAVLYVGKLLVMERGVNIDTPHTPLNFGRSTQVSQGWSDAGDYLGTIVTGRYCEATEQFSHLSPGWYRSEFDPFVSFAAENPFFYVWRPSEYPNEVGFAKLTADVKPSLAPKTNRFSVQLQMRGVLQ